MSRNKTWVLINDCSGQRATVVRRFRSAAAMQRVERRINSALTFQRLALVEGCPELGERVWYSVSSHPIARRASEVAS